MPAAVVATDRFTGLYGGVPSLTWPLSKGVLLVHSDTDDLVNVSRALYVGVTGDVKVDLYENGVRTTVTFKAVPVGILPVRASRVYAAGTTATSVLSLE